MTKRIILLILPIIASLGLLALFLQSAQTALATDWQSKVSPAVLTQLSGRSNAEVEVLVQLNAQADLSGAADLQTKAAKTRFVYEQLTAVAQTSQQPLQAFLDAEAVNYRSYWVNNTIWLAGTAELIETIASREDVAYLYANPQVQFDEPESVAQQTADALEVLAVEWGVERIGAPLVWADGITGTGVVIAGQDTGYVWDHPALIRQYRGWDSEQMTVTHDYNWHDAVQEEMSGNGSNPCGYQITAPCDDNSHGTHTMGTMVGDDGAGNQVGVAPGAKWISCRNMEQGYGSPETYIDCFQWFLAPTDLNGENPRPDLAPHIINNSWGCPPFEGCSPDNFPVMEAVVDNLRTAGIIVVTSAGNSGSSCGSVDDPAAIFDSSVTVGNTTSTDSIANSSSRGPVLVDGSGRPKPDLSAPGTSIRSTALGSSYSFKTGTSMAAPHVAGAFALLISAHPQFAGDVDLLEEILLQTTVPITGISQECGGIAGNQLPNNIVGHGRLNVYEAVNSHIVQLETGDTPLTVTVGMPFTHTFTVTHHHLLSNSGPLTLSSALPADVTVISATLPFTRSAESLQFTLADLAPSEAQAVTVTLEITSTTTLTETSLAWKVTGDNLVTVTSPAETIMVEGGMPPMPTVYYYYMPLFMREE